MTQAIQNVSDTAFMVGERPQPLFRDPFAWKLAGEHGRKILATVPGRFVGAWSVAIRTVIIDGFIRQAIAQGVDTILNLGAGLDTRPYRLQLPKSLHWIEVDFPHVIELKEARLTGEQPRCRLDRIKLDLTDRAQRQKFLADTATQAGSILVLTEGVMPYLNNADVAALADDLRQVKNIRFWVIDYFSPQALRYGEKLRSHFMRNAPFQFKPGDWFGFFEQRGWHAEDSRYIYEEAERLGRPIPLPFFWRLWLRLADLVLSRARREQMKRFAAYVLLTPN